MYIFKRRNPGLIIATLLITVVVACQGETPRLANPPNLSPAPPLTSTPTSRATPSPTHLVETPTIATSPPESSYLPHILIEERAQEALATWLGISSEEIEVVEVEEVEWPDTSLGCPEPGMVYAQVITPGWRAEMKARGEVYEYHSGAGHGVLCHQRRHLTSIVPSPTVTSVAVPSAPTPTIEDVCPMMPVFPHGRVCPTPWTPHD